MDDSTKDTGTGVSRREWLKTAGLAGAAAVVPGALQQSVPAGGVVREPLETLTQPEADALEAVAARLIPSDEHGPGAREARAAHYIDRALGGALASSREAYRDGLAAVDRYARSTKGERFADLSPADQDAVLTDMERNVATGFVPSASAFFALLRTHTIHGTFCDPYYGGNRNFVGWDLIGYPGLRLAVAEADQRLDAKPAPSHTSAYDDAMFAPKPPRAGLWLRLIRHAD
ncbi:MAG: gluconate 2-dehydrogenase subunit 3 family protein [Acidobacteria bacterium]|nr:gluconate 2-dehydrogenase subunit 3 family protein [Acidobacteriota bacterium]